MEVFLLDVDFDWKLYINIPQEYTQYWVNLGHQGHVEY